MVEHDYQVEFVISRIAVITRTIFMSVSNPTRAHKRRMTMYYCMCILCIVVAMLSPMKSIQQAILLGACMAFCIWGMIDNIVIKMRIKDLERTIKGE